MKLSVWGKNIALTEALRTYVTWRFQCSLGRFGMGVIRVNARLTGQPSETGQEKVHCHVHAVVAPAEKIALEVFATDAYQAIDHATERLERTVARTLARQRDVANARSGATMPF